MNPVQFGEGACEKTRRYLDSYVSNELLVETNHAVLQHLEECPSCEAEVEGRSRLRGVLKTAVERQSVPADLRARVRQRIRAEESRAVWNTAWLRWSTAAAASVLVCGLVWMGQRREPLPSLADRPAQNAFIQRVSATLAGVLRVGLGDHIHCSVFRKYPQNPPTVEQMQEKLGPSYQGLLPLVKQAVPEGYRVIMAHQCGYAGRKFIHLTLEKNGELLSLVIARKNPGETLAGLSPSQSPDGIPVYASSAERFQVAGFETGEYLAFVVSELNRRNNLQIAASLAPAVHEFLGKA